MGLGTLRANFQYYYLCLSIRHLCREIDRATMVQDFGLTDLDRTIVCRISSPIRELSLVLSEGGARPALRGSRRSTCCTSDGLGHGSCREIKACKVCPRTLSREKNLPNRRDLPSLERLAGSANLAYSNVAERATRDPTCPYDREGEQILLRLLRNLRRVQALDLAALVHRIINI